MSHSTRSRMNLFSQNKTDSTDVELTDHYNKIKKQLLADLQSGLKKQGIKQDEINNYLSENWVSIKKNLREQYIEQAQKIVNQRGFQEKNSSEKKNSPPEEKHGSKKAKKS